MPREELGLAMIEEERGVFPLVGDGSKLRELEVLRRIDVASGQDGGERGCQRKVSIIR